VHDKAEAEKQLQGAVGRLMALAEAYPDLKANTNFLNLQDNLADIENKLSAARRFFNNAVSELNAGIQSFPAVLFSRQMGFKEQEFFDLGDDNRKQLDVAPSIKF
jgi:LemA protein